MKLLFIIFLVSTQLWAQVPDPVAAVTKESYEAIIDKAQLMFAPYVELLGKKLIIEKNWESTELSSYTSYERPPLFKIVLNGAAYRNEATTNDGFTYTLCHEISHIIGGRPNYVNDDFWGSAEGQADYMATNICLKNLFKDDSNVALLPGLNVPLAVTQLCNKAYSSKEDSALCQRSILAGRSFAENYRLYKISSFTGSRNTARFRSISAPLSFTKRDSTVVRELNRSYSIPQCRLDSAVSGALCTRGMDFHLNTVNDPNLFNCEGNDVLNSHRPKCWYK